MMDRTRGFNAWQLVKVIGIKILKLESVLDLKSWKNQYKNLLNPVLNYWIIFSAYILFVSSSLSLIMLLLTRAIYKMSITAHFYLSWLALYSDSWNRFPWDYSASELGAIDVFNPATAFIDFFAMIGWAYDRKIVSREMIERKQMRSAKLEDIRKVGGISNTLYEWIGGISIFIVPILIAHIFKLSFS